MAKRHQLGHLQAVEIQGESPNPNFAPEHAGRKDNPQKINVIFNANESPPAQWYHRNRTINEAQLRAADHFRRIWEGAGGAGAGSLDYTKERVDTSSRSDPISIRQMDSAMHLKVAENHIGQQQYRLIRDTCGNGNSISSMFDRRKDRDAAMKLIKEGLDRLSEMWGYSTREKPSTIHPYQGA